MHDWETWKKRTKFNGELPPTLFEFMNEKIDNKYTPLSSTEITKWFLLNKDSYLLTDKIDDPIKILNNFRKIKDRIIIELFTQESINKAIKNNIGNILISQRVLWRNNYNEKYLKILAQNKSNILGFAVNKSKVFENPKFFKKARKLGFKVYVYGINEKSNYNLIEKNNEKQTLCSLNGLIDGIYADFVVGISPNLKENCN